MRVLSVASQQLPVHSASRSKSQILARNMPQTATRAFTLNVQKEKTLSQVTLDWNANVEPNVSYSVFRGASSDNEGPIALNSSPLIFGAGVQPTYTDSTVLPGSRYFYRVAAFVLGLESPFSNEVESFFVPFPPGVANISLGRASGFGVLAATTLTNTGPSEVRGDIGVAPGTSIVGFDTPGGPGFYTGSEHIDDLVALAAQADALVAFNAGMAVVNAPGEGDIPGLPAIGPFIVTSCATGGAGVGVFTGTFLPGLNGGLVGRLFTIIGFLGAGNNPVNALCTASTITTITLNVPVASPVTAEVAPGTGASATSAATAATSSPKTNLGTAANIGGMTLAPGVYSAPDSLGITGNLVLDAGGNADAVWVFQVGTALTMAGNIILRNGAQPANVYWMVGSSATLGAGSLFSGILIAKTSITAVTGASIDGQLIALTGAVTMDSNDVAMFIPITLVIYAHGTSEKLGNVFFDCASGTYQEVIVPGTTSPAGTVITFNPIIGGIIRDGSFIWETLDPPVGSPLQLPSSQPVVAPVAPAAPTGLVVVSES